MRMESTTMTPGNSQRLTGLYNSSLDVQVYAAGEQVIDPAQLHGHMRIGPPHGTSAIICQKSADLVF